MPVAIDLPQRYAQNTPRYKLLRLAKAKWELGQRAKRDPLRLFRPHPKQAQFLEDDHRVRLFVGGNRAGKTTVLVMDWAYHFFGFKRHRIPLLSLHTSLIEAGQVPRGDRVLTGVGGPVRPPIKGMIVANGLDHGIGSVIIPKLREWLGPYIKQEIKGSWGGPTRMIFCNDSVLDFRSYDQDWRKFESADWDWVGFDEPPPREVWIAVRRGLHDRGGKAVFALTPLCEPWIYDEIHLPGLEENPEYKSIEVTLYDNPYNEEDTGFVESLTEEEREVRVYGRWPQLMGRVYSSFNRDAHVIVPFAIPPEWPRWMVLDPHDRRPCVMIWAAIDLEGRIYVYREWPEKPIERLFRCDYDLKAYVDLIETLEANDMDKDGNRLPIWRIIDPNWGRNRRMNSGISLAEDFGQHGLYFDERVSDDVPYGHTKVKEYLAYDPKRPIDELNRPHLMIFNHCRNVIWSIEHYIYDNRNRARDAVSIAVERPREVGKDACDLLRYLCVSEPSSLTQRPYNRYTGHASYVA